MLSLRPNFRFHLPIIAALAVSFSAPISSHAQDAVGRDYAGSSRTLGKVMGWWQSTTSPHHKGSPTGATPQGNDSSDATEPAKYLKFSWLETSTRLLGVRDESMISVIVDHEAEQPLSVTITVSSPTNAFESFNFDSTAEAGEQTLILEELNFDNPQSDDVDVKIIVNGPTADLEHVEVGVRWIPAIKTIEPAAACIDQHEPLQTVTDQIPACLIWRSISSR